MSESKGEGGSWLYGLLLILSGGFILVTGILTILGMNPISGIPGIDPSVANLANITGWTELAIGVWGIIGGIGLIKDQEWGWGISLVVLSIVIVKTITNVISGILAAIADPLNVMATISFWVYLVPFIIAVVGIIYLLLTKHKYA
ncbi:MAG: hypothetical protein ACTSPY_01470 [Candidatus Helarchaeota archaeon]